MKPFNQSNSMKELLKKLKRHDVMVMAGGVMAATLVCGVLVYATTPAISVDAAQQEIRKDSLGVQKKTSDQLNEIDSYLERLDSVITGSQELVKEIQTVQNEQKELTNQTLEREKNNNNKTETTKDTTKVVEKINGLDKEFATLHSEIKSTTDQIKDLKTQIEKGNGQDTGKDKESFSQITNALSDIKKSCDKSGTEVSGLIAELKNRDKENNTSTSTIVNNLEKIEREIQKTDTVQTLSRMEGELKSTQTTYINAINDLEKSLSKEVDNVEKNVAKNVEKNVNGVGKKIDEGISSLDKNVQGVGQRVDSGMSSINSDVKGVEQKMESGMSSLDNNVNGVGNKVDKGFSNLDENVSNINESVQQGISAVNDEFSNVREQQKNTRDDIGILDGKMTGIDGKLNKIDGDIKIISEKLETVFKNVAGGKKELASALATLGVNVGEDAKFSEIANAIKTIPEAIVKSSDVEYEVHHHQNASGRCPNEISPTQGGCFQTPLYHKHTDACLRQKYKYKYITRAVNENHMANASRDEQYYCSYCKQYFRMPTHEEIAEDEHTAKQRAEGKIELISNGYVIVCGKNNSSIEGYAPNCGYKENSIVKAIIKYRKQNNITPNMLNQSLAVDFENGQILDDFINDLESVGEADENTEYTETEEGDADNDAVSQESQNSEMERFPEQPGQTQDSVDFVNPEGQENSTEQQVQTGQDNSNDPVSSDAPSDNASEPLNTTITESPQAANGVPDRDLPENNQDKE